MIEKLKFWGDRHDKLAHMIVAVVVYVAGDLLPYIDGMSASLGFITAIEFTQGDIFGLKGREKDTFYDYLAGLIAIGIYYALKCVLNMYY